MTLRPATLALVAAALCASGALALQQVRSLYTVLDLGECRAVTGAGHGEARLCEGLPGYPVFIAESDRGTFLSVGPDAGGQRAARQTLKSFNRLFSKTESRTTIEWRFVVREEQTVPYATIVRYHTFGPGGDGEVLVVSRVSEREVCHVAYIDALANVDAIVLARKLADTVARSEGCPLEPSVEGAAGRSPM